MGEKVYFAGRWVDEPHLGSISHIKAGYREPGLQILEEDIDCRIHLEQLNQLIPFLLNSGRIKSPVNENRTEDIKVIHRLIDVVEKRK